MRRYKAKRYKVCIRFGKNVQRERKKQKVSQEKLAAKVGIHRNHMGRIEREDTNPPLYKVYKIVKALGATSSQLLPF